MDVGYDSISFTKRNSSMPLFFRRTDDYRSHTTCMTEVERYEKRTPAKKGKVSPQQQWMDLIQSAVERAPSHLRQYLQTMASLDNVPRKEKPFRNWTANSLNLRKGEEKTVAEIWAFLNSLREMHKAEKEAAADSDSKENATQRRKAVDSETDEKSAPVNGTKKARTVARDKSVDKSNEKKPDKRTVKKAMKKVLKKASDRSLSLKRLRKAVQSHLGVAKSCKSDVKALISQNLGKGKKFHVEGKTVTLRVE
jgi:hypothetical protein